MPRRVAAVLGANVHVKIQSNKKRKPPVVAEAKVSYRVKSIDVHKRRELQKF